MNEIEMLNEHCEFNDPYDCYVIMAVSRKKDTPEITNSQEIVFREVIKNEKDIKRKYLKIKAMCENYKDEDGKTFPFYMYITLNARNSLKATFGLRAKMDLWMEEVLRGIDRSQFFKKVYGHFYSTLMEKESRSKHTKYFMFDIDTKEHNKVQWIDEELKMANVGVVQKIETKNGWHYKVKPFNHLDIKDLLEDVEYKKIIELKRDCLMFVEYVKNA